MLDAGNLPEYLRVKIRVVDDRGKTLDSGSDLDALKQAVLSRPGMELPQAAPEPSHPLTRSGLTDWTLDELPTKLEVGRQLKLVRYPALVDNGDSVSVVLLSDPVRARAESRLGLVRLLRLRTGQQSRQILKLFLARQKSWGLKLPPWLNDKDCAEDFIIAVYFHCFDARDSIPGDKAAFEDRLNNGRAQLYAAAELLLGALDRAVEASCDIRRKLTQLGRPHQEKLTSDVGEQLEHLFSACFLRHIGFDWISQLPRYCQAIDYRLDKAAAQPDRDADLLAKLMPAWQRLLRLERGDRSLNAFVEDDADLQQYRWMVEEFRVSLFAQPLGTKLPVSSQRLDRLWQKISAQG
jgi:ATP-dependent helicase HrpA